MIRASEHVQKQPSHAEGFFMPNTCKERYECNNCCKDMIALMKLSEFSIFVQAWLAQGRSVAYLGRKSALERHGSAYTDKNKGSLVYAANRTVEEYRETGRHGNTQVVAVFSDLCANNSTEEATAGQCGIYDQRPPCCKNFKLDGHDCKQMRSAPIELQF